jgi:predicted nucleotidyltransferase
MARRFSKAYSSVMWLLAREGERRQQEDEALAARTRDPLRAALARHIPGTPVWVYGSLVAPGRFHEWSDVDVALEWLPSGMTLEYLRSLLSADVAFLTAHQSAIATGACDGSSDSPYKQELSPPLRNRARTLRAQGRLARSAHRLTLSQNRCIRKFQNSNSSHYSSTYRQCHHLLQTRPLHCRLS